MIFGPASKASRRQSNLSLARFVDDSNEQLESQASLRMSKKAPRLSLPPSARGSRGQLKITILHDTLFQEPHPLASPALASARPTSLAPPPTPITPVLTSHRPSTAGLTPTSPNPTTPTTTTPILNGRTVPSPSSLPYTRSERDLTRHVTTSGESTACGSDDTHTLVEDSWSLRRSLAKQRKKSVGSLKQVWANMSGRSAEEQRETLAMLRYLSSSSADLAPSPMPPPAPSPTLPSLQQESLPATEAESPTLPSTMAPRPMHPAVPRASIMPRRSSLHSMRLDMPPPSAPHTIPTPFRPNRHTLSEHPFRMSTATTSRPSAQASLNVAMKKSHTHSIPDIITIPDMPPLPPEYASQNLRTASVCSSPTTPHSIRRKPVPQLYNLDTELTGLLASKIAPPQRARHPFAASAPVPSSHEQHRRDRALTIDEPSSAPPTTAEFSFNPFATTESGGMTAAVPPLLPPPRHPPPPRPPRRLSQRPLSTYLHQSHLSRR